MLNPFSVTQKHILDLVLIELNRFSFIKMELKINPLIV